MRWFPFYYDRFFGSEKVAMMSYEQVGCYVRLLSCQWKQGSIPADHALLAALLRLPPADFERIWGQIAPCFHRVPNSPRLREPNLWKIYQTQAKHHANLSDAGRKGAESPKRKGVKKTGKIQPGCNGAGDSLQPGFSQASALDKSSSVQEEHRADGVVSPPPPDSKPKQWKLPKYMAPEELAEYKREMGV